MTNPEKELVFSIAAGKPLYLTKSGSDATTDRRCAGIFSPEKAFDLARTKNAELNQDGKFSRIWKTTKESHDQS